MNLKIWIKVWTVVLLILGLIVYQKTVNANSDLDQTVAVEDLKPIKGVDYRQLRCMATANYQESPH